MDERENFMFKLQEIKVPREKITLETYINSGDGAKLIDSKEEILYDVTYIPSGDFSPQTDEENLRDWNKLVEILSVDEETQEKIDKVTKAWKEKNETIL